MAVHVWVRWIFATVGVIETSTRGRIVVNRATSWGRSIASAVIVVIPTAGWAPVTIAITTGTVSTGRATAVVVIRVGSTTHRGAGSSPVARIVWLSLREISIYEE